MILDYKSPLGDDTLCSDRLAIGATQHPVSASHQGWERDLWMTTAPAHGKVAAAPSTGPINKYNSSAFQKL